MSSASQDNRASATLSLMHAASEGDVQTMKALLAGAVDVNATNQGGQTALMLAALMGHSEIVTLLLAAGADPSSRDRLGLTALDWSQRRGFPDVTQLLAGVSPPIIRPTSKSTSSAEEKSKTESTTAITRESDPKNLEPATKPSHKTFQTPQSEEIHAEAVAEPSAPAPAKSDAPEIVTSSEIPHVSEVAIPASLASGIEPVETEAPREAPILDIEPLPQPTAEVPDSTPKPPELSTSQEPRTPEVTVEDAPPVSEPASVETEGPILEISPEPESQPAVNQPLDVVSATSMVLPQEPPPSKPEIISAATAEPVEEHRQDEEEETLTRAGDPGIPPNAPRPAAAAPVSEPIVSESPRMRAARLAATIEHPPAFETSTLGITATPKIDDEADVGELKRCPKCNTELPECTLLILPSRLCKINHRCRAAVIFRASASFDTNHSLVTNRVRSWFQCIRSLQTDRLFMADGTSQTRGRETR